jgi:hypothetical protein
MSISSNIFKRKTMTKQSTTKRNWAFLRTNVNKEFHLTRTAGSVLWVLLVLFQSLCYLPLQAQNGEVVVFSENWNDSYSLEPWAPNYASGWFTGNPKNQVVPYSNHGNVLRVNFASGDIGGGVAGIGNYRIYLDSMYRELYFSWEYYLDPAFDYGYADTDGGGKFFGGLSGGNRTNVPRVPSDTSIGWTYFMMFHNGDYFTYPYFYNHEYWDGYPSGNEIAPIYRGEWREVTIRLRVNEPNKANGFVEMFDNGRMVFRKTDYQMTSPTHPEWMIDALLLNVFFGGSSPCPKAQYAMFDNMVAWYYPKSSSQYRAGTSEAGRLVYAPRVSNYHPKVPNQFTPTTYTDARGTVRSHCGFAMPIVHDNNFQTSTIEISDATRISINVTKFSHTYSTWSGSQQILKIYSGKGDNRTLVQTFDPDTYTRVPTAIEINGNTATIEWQAGSGDRQGFNLQYTSDGTGTGKNFTCGDFTAVQNGAGQSVTPVDPPPTDPNYYTPKAPTNLQITAVTGNTISLRWTDNSQIEEFYEIERQGPGTVKKIFKVSSNTTTYLDAGLESLTKYSYSVRAYHSLGGYSASTTKVEATTLAPLAPLAAPTSLKTTGFSNSSITINWNDNSTNESGFLVTRSLALDPDSAVTMVVDANTTVYTDDSLSSNTTYVYTVKAINTTGTSASSNKNVTTTLSLTETRRVTSGLIAYYNFGYDPDYNVQDLSGFGEPVNMRILKPTAVQWNDNNRLQITSNTAIVSNTPARKIISELRRTGQLTFECWIRPSTPSSSSNSRVVSLAVNDDEAGFILDQQFSGYSDDESLNYSVRLQTESTNKSGYPEIVPVQSMTYLNMQHVIYIRDTIGNEVIYLNGERAAEGFRPSSFDTWSNDFYLRLGNEKDMTHPWTGTFYSLAIYNKALSAAEIKKNYKLGPCDNIRSSTQEFKISVYPNPVSSLATIEVLPISAQDYVPLTTVRLLDMYGKVHFETTIFNPDQGYRDELDFGRYARGIYFLQVISGSAQNTSKIIAQ